MVYHTTSSFINVGGFGSTLKIVPSNVLMVIHYAFNYVNGFSLEYDVPEVIVDEHRFNTP